MLYLSLRVLDIEQRACHRTGRFPALVGALQFEVRKESSGILLQTEKSAGQPLVDVIVRRRREATEFGCRIETLERWHYWQTLLASLASLINRR